MTLICIGMNVNVITEFEASHVTPFWDIFFRLFSSDADRRFLCRQTRVDISTWQGRCLAKWLIIDVTHPIIIPGELRYTVK
jgi:hypothetical protein